MQHILPLLLLLPLATSYLSPSDFDRLVHTVPLPFYSTSTTIGHSSKGRPLSIYTLTSTPNLMENSSTASWKNCNSKK